MSSIYGEAIRLSVFGQSHGPAIGMTLDGVPAGLPIDILQLQQFLGRRKPGANSLSSPRQEMDSPEFIAGIVDSFTCGSPITAIIRNADHDSSGYANFKECPRPGHADFTAHCKYNGYHDVAGGGHFSGRLTAPICIAGGLCKQWLQSKGIQIRARIFSIADIIDEPNTLNYANPLLASIQDEFPVLNHCSAVKMQEAILLAKNDGDSVGGIIECIATGLPAGLGDPIFGGMESRIASIIFGIPAVKGLDFGSGFQGSSLRGSQNNDAYTVQNGHVVTSTNHCGGILGGITNGMPLIFKVAIKPTPSIQKPQNTISLQTMENKKVKICGRHDPCIVPRAVPVVEAAAAIAIFDAYLSQIGGF